MRKYITASYDTTIYEKYPTLNTGLDEIIEVGKIPSSSFPIDEAFVSCSARALLDFNLDYTWTGSASYFLNLKLANAESVKYNQYLVVGHVSESWDEGTGYFYQQPYNAQDGATWNQKSQYVSWSLAGSPLITSPVVSGTLTPDNDFRIDVTNIIAPLISQSLSFNGFYIKYPTTDEDDFRSVGNIKFFSVQTHTIHQPTLEIVWADQTFVTGTLKPIPPVDPIIVTTNQLSTEIQKGTVQRVRLTVRNKFPERNFNGELRFSNKYYLPSESYFRIVDSLSGVTYGLFDQYNAINCDATSSYFTLDTSPLYRNRIYHVEISYNTGNGGVSFAKLNEFEIV
jgi:hypothetical protein